MKLRNKMSEFEMNQSIKSNSENVPIRIAKKLNGRKRLKSRSLRLLLGGLFLASLMIVATGCDLGTYKKRMNERNPTSRPPAETGGN